MNCPCHRICCVFSCNALRTDVFLKIFTDSFSRIILTRRPTLRSELDILCIHNLTTMVQAGKSRVRLPAGVTDFFQITYSFQPHSSRWPRGIFYPQKLALTSPTSGGRSVGIVRSRTQAMEFFPCHTTALGSIQPLVRVSTRDLSGGLSAPDTLPPSVSRLSRQCGSLDVSQPYGPTQPLRGIALLFDCNYLMYVS
jgi:hypothetical protein